MKRLESFHCKLLTALIAAIILLAILINYAADLENRSRVSINDQFDEMFDNGSSTLPHQPGFDHVSPRLYQNLINDSIISRDRNKDHQVQNMGLATLILADKSSECAYSQACEISCYGGTLEETIGSINALVTGDKCSKAYQSLIIRNTKLTNDAINSGWLQGITVGINNLNMISIDLGEIGDSVFSGQPFGTHSNPLKLALTDTAIRTLKKSTFIRSSISSLEINYDIISGINIEEDIFSDTSSSIQVIILNKCLTSGEALKNLTGKGSILTGLETLDLSYNMLSKLENYIFSKTPNVKQLYLMSSGINEIEPGALQGLTQIMQLHLSGNNLKTLPDGLFDDTRSLISLYISGNPWKCECDMQWFKEYLSKRQAMDFEECRVGSSWVDMEDVNFCPENYTSTVTTPTVSSTETTKASSTPSTVTSTTETTATTNIPNKKNFVYEKILCRSLLSSPFDYVDDNDKVTWYESIFKRRDIKYIFSEIRDTPIFTVDLLTDANSDDFLIWTNVNNRTDYGCVFDITSSILMRLQYEETYTICLSSNDTTDSYALIANDCTAIATPPAWAHRAWLLNSQKTITIVCVAVTFITTVIVVSVTVYYLVKCNPELIKGNKRVLIVKRGSYSPNVLVMPSKKDRHFSLCTDNGGYLTPKLKHLIQKSKMSDMRYHELETITDRSSISENCDDIEKDIYEPPPLPPNHPTKRRDSGRPYFYSNM